jgi:hypothetical protein
MNQINNIRLSDDLIFKFDKINIFIGHPLTSQKNDVLKTLKKISKLVKYENVEFRKDYGNSISFYDIEKFSNIFLNTFNNSDYQIFLTTDNFMFINYLDAKIFADHIYFFYTINDKLKYFKYFKTEYVKDRVDCMGLGETLVDINTDDYIEWFEREHFKKMD